MAASAISDHWLVQVHEKFPEWNLDMLLRPIQRFTPAYRPLEQRRVQGGLDAFAMGDALGGPAESKSPQQIRDLYGVVDDYLPHHGLSAPSITDDTQMMLDLWVSLFAHRTVNPIDLAERFPKTQLIGIGRATRAAFARLKAGASWLDAGEPSAGNGAAMRAHPLGVVFDSLSDVRLGALLQALPTHSDRSAIAGAMVVALMQWVCLRIAPCDLDVPALFRWVADAIDGFEVPLALRHRPEIHTTLREQMRWLAEHQITADEAAKRFHNGAYVLETLPTALAIFAQHKDNVGRALLTAVRLGYDADTVAAIVGGWLGALLGTPGTDTDIPPQLFANPPAAGLCLTAMIPYGKWRRSMEG